MPHTESTDRAGVAVAEPASACEEHTRPAIPLRRADGHLSRFDEIVTPHPVAAFLFRRRTLIVLIAIVALVPLAKPDPAMLGVGMILALLAEGWRIWAAGTIHKTEELTTGGPYAYVRHPLYVGSFLHAVAYCFMSGHWLSFFVVLPLFCLVYGAAVSIEEAMLYKLFGERYAAYSRRVARFVPRLRLPERGHGQFAWHQVMANREYINVIWMVALSGLFVYQLVAAR